MANRRLGITFLIALATVPAVAAAAGNGTIMTLPRDVVWIRDTSKNGPHGSYYAYLRGKRGDDCDWLRINKFPSGYEYPVHVNHAYWLFTILSGTLVLGFDSQHRKSGERFLPAGTIMQGLAEEPHYGRAIGETTFEIYAPCLKR